MKDYKALQNGSDIRGVALPGIDGQNVNLTEEAAEDLSRAFAVWLSKKTGKAIPELVIAVGRDSRLSGPGLASCVENSLASMGVLVYDCGLSSTPAMFMSTVFPQTNTDGAVMITASHLPFNRNGFKFFTKDGGLEKADIKALIEAAQGGEELEPGSAGKAMGAVVPLELMELYSAHLRSVICAGIGAKEEDKPLSGLHVVCDAGNGAGGFYVSKVLEPLGADCFGSVYLEPDGSFPNHQPNPENKEAMDCICGCVRKSGADLGIIFDTDVDRASAVDSQGRAIARNGIVALASVIAMQGHPGTTVVTDSITSNQLGEFLTAKLGLKHLRFKRGYRNVINRAIELNACGTDCQLAIETSGHAALKENYFLDDGAYLAAKIVVQAALLKKEGKAIEALLEGLEEPLEAREVRIAVNTDDFASYADAVLSELKDWIGAGECTDERPCGGRCKCGMSLEEPNYEGIRVNCDERNGDGWFLLRKSLHDPLMPLNIESNAPGGADMIWNRVRKLLAQYDKLDLR